MEPVIVSDYDFLTPVYEEGYPKRTRDEDGKWTREERFLIHSSVEDTFIPAVRASSGDLNLVSVEVDDSIAGFPDIHRVTLKWGVPEIEASGWNGIGTNTDYSYESDSQRTEKRLAEHPGMAAITDDADRALLEKYYPVFVVITVTFRKITRIEKGSFTFSESTIIGNTNLKETPEDIADATANRWMNLGRSIRFTAGEYVEITDSWQYDLYEWKGAIGPSYTVAQALAWLKSNGYS